jgi:hypothetical protein
MGAGALASILSAASENGSGIATGAWMLAGGLGAVGAVGLLRRRG